MLEFGPDFSVLSEFNSFIFIIADMIFDLEFEIFLIFLVILSKLADLFLVIH